MKKFIFIKVLFLITYFLFIGIIANSQITINEVICKDEVEAYFTDEEGGGTDWVELYNAGNSAVNIALMRITDDESEVFTDCEEIPDTDAITTTIEAGGFLILICGAKDINGDKVPTSISDGIIYIKMGIKASSTDNVILYDTNETELDRTGDIPDDLEEESSYGKTENGGAVFQTFFDTKPKCK